MWHAIVGELWDGLADAVRTGRPPGGFYPWLEQRPRLSAAFHTLQGGLASWLAEEVVELAGPLEGATCLLDLGGGHGLYSEAFCRAHPRLTATVVDLPGALEDGTTHERVTRHAADLAKEGVDGEYDVVLLFNVLHGFPEDEARGLLARAAGAVRQGGRLLVLETVLEPTDEHRGGQAEAAFTAGFSLSLWHTQGGAVRPARTIEDWLGEAGCVALARHELSRSGHAHALHRRPRRTGGAPMTLGWNDSVGLVVADVDDTLAPPFHDLGDELADELTALLASGVRVLLASGGGAGGDQGEGGLPPARRAAGRRPGRALQRRRGVRLRRARRAARAGHVLGRRRGSSRDSARRGPHGRAAHEGVRSRPRRGPAEPGRRAARRQGRAGHPRPERGPPSATRCSPGPASCWRRAASTWRPVPAAPPPSTSCCPTWTRATPYAR
ncbi:methyltransferase [Nonomuraea dietziae]|uniref:methyltransferase n=1 Tax=Nonomuraea dietziae TaxID=65515 RepID=UPI0031D98B54